MLDKKKRYVIVYSTSCYDDRCKSLNTKRHVSHEEDASSLVKAFMPYIKKRASRIRSVGLAYDDIVQEGLIGLLDAIDGYDDSRGAFEAFALVCIDNRIYAALRHNARKKNLPLNDYLSISDGDDRLDLPQASSPEELVILREEVGSVYRHIRENLSSFEKSVLSLYLEGYSYLAISEMLSSSAKSVDNALQRARKKLK